MRFYKVCMICDLIEIIILQISNEKLSFHSIKLGCPDIRTLLVPCRLPVSGPDGVKLGNMLIQRRFVHKHISTGCASELQIAMFGFVMRLHTIHIRQQFLANQTQERNFSHYSSGFKFIRKFIKFRIHLKMKY